MPKVRGKLAYNGNAEILTVHTPPSQCENNKDDIKKPLSPIPQPFDDKNVGISKHIQDVKKTVATG